MNVNVKRVWTQDQDEWILTTSTMTTEERKARSNKLRDGPCAERYFELEQCSMEKKISSHMVRGLMLGLIPCHISSL